MAAGLTQLFTACDLFPVSRGVITTEIIMETLNNNINDSKNHK